MDISHADWLALDNSRFGPLADLVVSLRMRESLGRSDLIRVDLMSAEALVLGRESWPVCWEEFVSSVDGGTFFRVGFSLRGGMDPAKQAELASIRFTPELEWSVLEQGYDALRRQEPLPDSFPLKYRRMAELLAEATQLYQWEPMLALPFRPIGNCTPARMAALKVLLDRNLGSSDRPLPPWITEGASGQIIELRFNSVPPPHGHSPEGVSTDTIKDWLLSRLVEAFPDLGTSLSGSSGVNYRWVRGKMRIDGDREGLGDYSMTALLPYGPWVSALVRRQVLIGGSYCTVAPFGTHVEVPLSPGDHAIFRGIRLSLGLSHTASLDLLEDAFYRAFKKVFVSCRFTTTSCTASGRGKKRVFTHFSLDDDRASTLITTGAENLLMARRRQLHTELQLGVDDQYPVTFMIQTPAPPQGVLYLMLESRGTPPIRLRTPGTLFVSDRVLLGPLPAGWLTSKIDFFSEVEQERVRQDMATVCNACLKTDDLQLVGRREHKKGRREKSDKSPLFVYLEFPGIAEAQAFGQNVDCLSLPPEFNAFWQAYVGTQVQIWSSQVLLEALEVVPADKWESLMLHGTQSPCPPPAQQA